MAGEITFFVCIMEHADPVTQMRRRHPLGRGVRTRKGVEF